MNAHRAALLALVSLMLGTAPVPGADEQPLPAYQKTGAVGGSMLAVGSDTMMELMTNWSEAFHVLHPQVAITLEQAGSGTAPPALIAGRSQLAPMSRPMKPEEIAAFTGRFGYPPTEIVVAIDGLAIFVHRDNPLKGVTLRQLEAIFSQQPAHQQARITRWQDAGVPSLGADPLTLYGRNSLSGTQAFFKQQVLGGKAFPDTVREQTGSEALIHGIAADRLGIGYCGIGYVTSGVRVVPVGLTDGEYFFPSPENCLSGTYPIARKLYLYINQAPSGKVDPLVSEFMRFILSQTGQEIVDTTGFYSMSAEQVAASLQKITR